MDRNYYFRRKRHSYAACDAALAASNYIFVYLFFVQFGWFNNVRIFDNFNAFITKLVSKKLCCG